jgi:hypothetical protein
MSTYVPVKEVLVVREQPRARRPIDEPLGDRFLKPDFREDGPTVRAATRKLTPVGAAA